MPTYEYLCQSCGNEFELFQQMSAPVKKKCSECGKLKLKRLVGRGSAVMFKGSGFYETDYRSESYKKDERAEKDAKKPKTEDKKKKDSNKKSSPSDSSPSKKE
ncbi:MAG: zinc ribbon domain-containing protein [Planctomycetota bacterium]|nr:zinc ribbon domain-containing protein [Planctomycetota bacterium]|tara:strand:+ start:26 stop:334 length:309 start_codon:yes stop_codon:yes gene_type:complete